MLARVLNIWVIKQRAKPIPVADPTNSPPHDGTPLPPDERTPPLRTSYHVLIGDGKARVRLVGTPEDLRAVTAKSWLRAMNHVEGFVEAIARLIVYLVAALSGNMTQAGQMIQLVLLLTTAGLLALSNAEAKSFHMNGRVAAPSAADDTTPRGRQQSPHPADDGGSGANMPLQPPQRPGWRPDAGSVDGKWRPKKTDPRTSDETEAWESTPSDGHGHGYYYPDGRRDGSASRSRSRSRSRHSGRRETRDPLEPDDRLERGQGRHVRDPRVFP